MNKTTERELTGIRSKITTKLEDLDFADDIVLLSSKHQNIQLIVKTKSKSYMITLQCSQLQIVSFGIYASLDQTLDQTSYLLNHILKG